MKDEEKLKMIEEANKSLTSGLTVALGTFAKADGTPLTLGELDSLSVDEKEEHKRTLDLLKQLREAAPSNLPVTTIAAFSERAHSTAVYPGAGEVLDYPLLGWIGETGELLDKLLNANAEADQDHDLVRYCFDSAVVLGRVAERLKKVLRDKGGKVDDEERGLIIGHLRTLADIAASAAQFADEADDENLINGVDLINGYKAADDETKAAIHKEVGDPHWYSNEAAIAMGMTLEEIFNMMLRKLASRAQRGTLHGSGDNR
jgi:hypothetical protein